MKSIQYLGLFLAAGLASILIGRSLPAVSQTTVQLQTQPPLNQIVPATEPVRLTLQATSSNQQSLANSRFQVRLLAPAKTPWLTSDSPIVEGTTLLEMNAIAPSGSLQFEQTLPIRGTYHLEVSIAPEATGAFEPFEQVLTFAVPENPVKYRNLALLATILLAAGLGSGWVLGGDQKVQDGEIAPQPVRMLLSAATLLAIAVLLVVNVGAEMADRHAHHTHAVEAAAPAMQRSQGIQVQLLGDDQATVGQTVTQTIQATDVATGRPIADLDLNLQVVALEHNEPIFRFAGVLDTDGKFTWQPQFFDGAPHRVTATLSASNPARQVSPIQVSHQVDVEGIAPPMSLRFISLMYFTAIFVVGWMMGLVIRRRLPQQRWRSAG